MIGFFFSIARFAVDVEGVFHVCASCNLPLQLHLRPSKPPYCLDIPHPLLDSQPRLQNDHILRPTDGHGLGQHLWGIFVCTVELTHPAQVAGRETGGVRTGGTQIFRRSYRRTLLRSAADQPANLTVQLHLRWICCDQFVQRGEHGAVVCGFPDVHWILPPFQRECAPIGQGREKRGVAAVLFSALIFTGLSQSSAQLPSHPAGTP